jgi:uncharacterized delta-60 repeat protein
MSLWVDPTESYALVSAFYNDGSSRLGVAKFDFSTRQCDTTYGTDFYSPNGSRTSDSNPDGFAEVDVIPGANSLEGSFHFQSDGSLIALVSDNSSVMKIAKVTASGSLDTTFNSSGVSPNFWSELSGGYGSFPDVFVLSNGSIRIVGYPRSGTSYAKIVALTSTGSLDSSFGNNGVVGSPVCSNIGIMGGAVRLPDGSIIGNSVYGTGFPTVYRTYLVKLGAGGSASQCGTTTTQPSGGGGGGGGGFGNSCSGGASLMPSSRTEMGTVGQPMSIAAPTPSGYSTAPTFTLTNNSYFPPGLNLSSNGSISGTPTSSASGMTSAITVSNGSQSCTYFVTFNITGNSTPCVAGAPSSTNSAVTFDSSFSSDGVYQIMNQSDSLPAVDVRPGPNGTIVVAALVGVNFGGGSPSNSSSNIYRMLPNGTLDSTWGTAGVANIDVNSSTTYGENVTSIEVLPDGSVVAAVQVYIAGPNPQQEVRLAKLTSAGVLDTGFATNGFATIHSGSGMSNVYVRDLQIAPSGSLYVIGFASGNSSSTKVYKVQANGSLDSSFATNGELTLPSQLSRVGADGSGNLYAGGQTSSNPTDARIVKYTSSGTADTAFGTNGEVVFNTSQTSSESIGAVAVANGKITAVVRVSSMGGMMMSFTESAVRVDTDGDVDASFGTAGVASLGTGSMSTQEIEFLSDGSAILSRFNMGMNPEWLMSAIGPDGSSIGTLVASPARVSSGACTLSDGSVAVASSGLYVAGAQYPNGSGPVSGFVFKIALDGVSSGGGSGGGSGPAPTLVTSANQSLLERDPGSEGMIVNGQSVTIETTTVEISAARTPAAQRTPAQVAAIQAAGQALLQEFLASLPAGAVTNVAVVNTSTGAVMQNLVFDGDGNSVDVPVEDIVILDGPAISLMIGSNNANITSDGKYQVGAGGIVGVVGAGLGANAPGEIVAMSTPTLLANFTTSANGDLSQSAQLPNSIGVGDHTLVVATGSTYAVMGLRVVPSALPTTGLSDESGRTMVIALFTMVFAAVLVRSRRLTLLAR